ncbi:MAG: YciI family protein [Chloroflexi bacterium]|nr:MAG: YciI family protein [Chloroflexota bacterium]TMD65737.1 MAG: YciI family protein [Chloroflexota bacterium]
MAKYLYLLYADESKMPAADSPQMQQQEAAFGRYYEELAGRGMFKAGDPVQPSKTATTVRVRNGSTKTADGPATTGSDQIIGFYVVEARNQDEAIAYAAKVPSASVGSIEVRPIIGS